MNNMLRLLIPPTPRSLSPTWPVKEHTGLLAILNSEWMGEGEEKAMGDPGGGAHFPYPLQY